MPWVILATIVIVALVLRLYRLPELTIFLGDQGRDAIVVDTMLRTGQPVLTGPVVSTGAYVRGPAYYYLLAPAFALAGGDPAGGAILTALADTSTVVLLAVLGRALGGWIVGLLAALLWATAGLTVTMARFMWNPQWIPPLAALCLLALLAVARGRPRWFVVVGPALAVSWQLHDQAVILGLAVAIWWLIVRPAVPWRVVVASSGLGVLATLPFLWHEATHDLVNLRAMVGQVLGGNAIAGTPRAGLTIDDQLRSLVGAAQQFMPGSGVVDLALWATAALGVVYCLRRVASGDDPPGPLALVILAALLPVFLLWPSPLQHYYLYIIWTAALLLVGLGTSWIWRLSRPLGALACLLVVIVAADSAIGTFGAIRDQPALEVWTLASSKLVVDEIVRDQGGRPFTVRLVSEYDQFGSYDAPYRYLLRRAAGPSSGRVDLPTVVIFEPQDHGGGPVYGGRVVAGTRYVAFRAPTLDVELARDADVATPGGVSPAWAGPQPGIETSSDAGRLHVRIVVRPEDQPLADGRTIAQAIDVSEPGRYLVRFEARTDLQSGSGRVIAETRDGGGGWLSVAPDGAGAELRAGPDWSVGSFFIDASEQTARIVVYLRNAGVGTVDVRGVSVRRVVSAVLPGASIH